MALQVTEFWPVLRPTMYYLEHIVCHEDAQWKSNGLPNDDIMVLIIAVVEIINDISSCDNFF